MKKTVQTGWDWDQERNEGLRAIGQLIELDVHRLWDPPVIEEDFVKYVLLPFIAFSSCPPLIYLFVNLFFHFSFFNATFSFIITSVNQFIH